MTMKGDAITGNWRHNRGGDRADVLQLLSHKMRFQIWRRADTMMMTTRDGPGRKQPRLQVVLQDERLRKA